MEPTDPFDAGPVDRKRHAAADRRGLAMFGVLVLVVIFTLLGVGAITLATRENQNSGSVLDIKSRQSAAYAGLMFALGEFQRDPANFVALLEAWRTKNVYGAATNPLPQLYLKFSPAGGAVELSKTKQDFAIPGTPYRIAVELAGVMVPASSSEAPVVVLRSTGTGRSGDAQTVVGTYRVRNVRVNSSSGANLNITHPFYVNCGGTWNNNLQTVGGDVYLGGNTHLNSSTDSVFIKGGGLKVKGDFDWDSKVAVTIEGNSWITGNMGVRDGTPTIPKTFKGHLVVDGNLNWVDNSLLTVEGALLVRGTSGIVDLHGGRLNVGSAGIAKSELYIPNGKLNTSDLGSVVNVTGPAYVKQITLTAGKPMILNVSGRLELAQNGGLQTFLGSGTWGRFVARAMSPASSFKNSGGSITINGDSWVETPANTILGKAGTPFGASPILFGGTSKLYYAGGATASWTLSPAGTATTGTAPGVNTATNGLTGLGFDLGTPPWEVADLGMSISPTDDKEMIVDLTKDTMVLHKAKIATLGAGYCHDNLSLCGSWLNKLRTDDIAAGSPHFYNGYFVLRIDNFGASPAKMAYDLGGTTMAPLVGKWLILVYSNMASNANPWPTTAVNADPANPTNIQFVYIPKGSGGSIFAGFQPRISSTNPPPLVTFTGYVRDDERANNTWDPKGGVDFRGAMHVMGSSAGTFTVNSGAKLPTFTLDNAVLNDIGAAFGKIFVDPITNQPLVSNVSSGFVATENWIQFQTLSELR
ncbi:MAG: hypothetical protein RL173_223 [Fibrobacterota bacterium]|jgi:hypothetical protein